MSKPTGHAKIDHHVARSAKDGRFVTDAYAEAHKDTTVRESFVVRVFKRIFRRKETT